jgi:hypothetical protein
MKALAAVIPSLGMNRSEWAKRENSLLMSKRFERSGCDHEKDHK